MPAAKSPQEFPICKNVGVVACRKKLLRNLSLEFGKSSIYMKRLNLRSGNLFLKCRVLLYSTNY